MILHPTALKPPILYPCTGPSCGVLGKHRISHHSHPFLHCQCCMYKIESASGNHKTKSVPIGFKEIARLMCEIQGAWQGTSHARSKKVMNGTICSQSSSRSSSETAMTTKAMTLAFVYPLTRSTLHRSRVMDSSVPDFSIWLVSAGWGNTTRFFLICR